MQHIVTQRDTFEKLRKETGITRFYMGSGMCSYTAGYGAFKMTGRCKNTICISDASDEQLQREQDRRKRLKDLRRDVGWTTKEVVTVRIGADATPRLFKTRVYFWIDKNDKIQCGPWYTDIKCQKCGGAALVVEESLNRFDYLYTLEEKSGYIAMEYIMAHKKSCRPYHIPHNSHCDIRSDSPPEELNLYYGRETVYVKYSGVGRFVKKIDTGVELFSKIGDMTHQDLINVCYNISREWYNHPLKIPKQLSEFTDEDVVRGTGIVMTVDNRERLWNSFRRNLEKFGHCYRSIMATSFRVQRDPRMEYESSTKLGGACGLVLSVNAKGIYPVHVWGDGSGDYPSYEHITVPLIRGGGEPWFNVVTVLFGHSGEDKYANNDFATYQYALANKDEDGKPKIIKTSSRAYLILHDISILEFESRKNAANGEEVESGAAKIGDVLIGKSGEVQKRDDPREWDAEYELMGHETSFEKFDCHDLNKELYGHHYDKLMKELGI